MKEMDQLCTGCANGFVMFLFILLTFLVLLLTSHLYFRYSRAGRLIAKIPGPGGWPIIGNVLQVLLPSDELFLYARKLRSNYKIPVVKLTSFNIRVVNIYDPDDIEKILSSSSFIEKRMPYTFLGPWLGQGLLISNGLKWHQRRKLLTSAFHFQILKQFSYTIIEQTETLMNRVQAEVGNPKTDLLPIITRASLRIMCETSMGTSMREGIESTTNTYFKAIHTLGHCVINRMIRPWLYPYWIFKFSTYASLQKSALKYLHGFTTRVIQERKVYKAENCGTNDDFDLMGRKKQQALLDLLLDNEMDNKIDDNGIREEVDTFMFEGHDTTAMALCFMIMRIANEPIVQDAIYQELQQVFCESQRPVTYEDLSEMKYLECCIKESLRIYPSVPYFARYITEEVVLGGYQVPVGTTCQINVFDIHRLEDVYPDPERFIPERFMKPKRHPYAYIPFSAGPRNCIGMKFAMMELKTVMSSLLRRFRLEPVTRPEDVRFTGDLVLRASHPLFVRFLSRNPGPYATLFYERDEDFACQWYYLGTILGYLPKSFGYSDIPEIQNRNHQTLDVFNGYAYLTRISLSHQNGVTIDFILTKEDICYFLARKKTGPEVVTINEFHAYIIAGKS